MTARDNRVRINGFEFTAAPLPKARTASSGSAQVARDALAAMDKLGCDSVLVIVDVSNSWVSGKNTAAKAEGIPVKFHGRKIDNSVHVFATRWDWAKNERVES